MPQADTSDSDLLPLMQALSKADWQLLSFVWGQYLQEQYASTLPAYQWMLHRKARVKQAWMVAAAAI